MKLATPEQLNHAKEILKVLDTGQLHALLTSSALSFLMEAVRESDYRLDHLDLFALRELLGLSKRSFIPRGEKFRLMPDYKTSVKKLVEKSGVESEVTCFAGDKNWWDNPGLSNPWFQLFSLPSSTEVGSVDEVFHLTTIHRANRRELIAFAKRATKVSFLRSYSTVIAVGSRHYTDGDSNREGVPYLKCNDDGKMKFGAMTTDSVPGGGNVFYLCRLSC